MVEAPSMGKTCFLEARAAGFRRGSQVAGQNA
jgi:hypothetical protein